MHIKVVVIITIFGLALGPSLSIAHSDSLERQSLAKIYPGMSQYDVLRFLSNPLEKEEKETLREEVWRFREGDIFFKEGKVLKINRPNSFPTSVSSASLGSDYETQHYRNGNGGTNKEPSAGNDEPSAGNETLNETNLSSIMKEVERMSEPDTSGGGTGSPPPYIQDPIPPPS